jgi:hypothetical protein
MQNLSPQGTTLVSFDLQHALFANQLPARFLPVFRIWICIRSVTLWTLWIARNDLVLARWSRAKIKGTMWTSLRDYGRASWKRLQSRKFKNAVAKQAAFDQFYAIWTPTATFVSVVRIG